MNKHPIDINKLSEDEIDAEMEKDALRVTMINGFVRKKCRIGWEKENMKLKAAYNRYIDKF